MVKPFNDPLIGYFYREGTDKDEELVKDIDTVVFVVPDGSMECFSFKSSNGREENIRRAKKKLEKITKTRFKYEELKTNVN